MRLRGDVLIAAVAGEIEKTQQGDAQGAEYRGYAAGSRYLVTHGGVADMCILGEPTENKLVLAHFGSLWLRLSTHGPFIHTAFSAGRREENSILRMRDVLDAVLEWLPEWEEEMTLRRRARRRERRRDRGRLRLARLADAAPHRSLPRPARAAGRADGGRAAQGARRSRARSTGSRREVYVTAPGAEIDGVASARRRARRGARGGVRRGAGARRHALVLRRVGADALRDPDRQLRHVVGAAGRRVRRESRHRRAREDGGGLRARGACGCAGSRERTTSTRCRRTCRCRSTTAPPITCSARCCRELTLESSRARSTLRELAATLVLYVYPRAGRPGRAVAARLGRHPGRARLHAAVVRIPRPRGGARASSARASRGSRAAARRPARVRGAEPHPVSGDRRSRARLGAALGLPTFDVEGVTLYKRITLVAEAGGS